jgi:hypothetical protein
MPLSNHMARLQISRMAWALCETKTIVAPLPNVDSQIIHKGIRVLELLTGFAGLRKQTERL